jgi:hypothetical protein
MSTPLRDLLHELLFDGPARAAFAAGPEQYLEDHGWDGLRGQDVGAALDALTDELPPDQAARIAPLAAGDGAFEGGLDDTADGIGGAIAGLEAAVAAIDGDLPPQMQSFDAASTFDAPRGGDAEFDLDIDRSDGLDGLDDTDDGGDVDLDRLDERDDDLDRSDDLASDDPDGFNELDELSFGTEQGRPAVEDEHLAGEEADLDDGGDPAAGIDFADDAPGTPDAGETALGGPSADEPGELATPGDDAPDDVID